MTLTYSANIIVPDDTELDEHQYLASDADLDLWDEVEEAVGTWRVEITFVHASNARGGVQQFATAYGPNGVRVEDASAEFQAVIARVYGVTF